MAALDYEVGPDGLEVGPDGGQVGPQEIEVTPPTYTDVADHVRFNLSIHTEVIFTLET